MKGKVLAVLTMVVVLVSGLTTTGPAAAASGGERAKVEVEVKEIFMPEWAKKISPRYIVTFDHLGGPFKESYQVYPGKNVLYMEPGPYLVYMQTELYDPDIGMYVGVATSYPWEDLGWVEIPSGGIWMDFYGRVSEDAKNAGYAIPPKSQERVTFHLILRVYLKGKWKYPVAVQAIFIPTDYNPPIQHGYKFATATSQRWVRFDFDLPQGGYKLFAYGGEAGKYSPYPYPVWAEAGPIPVRLDRDKDVTITLDP